MEYVTSLVLIAIVSFAFFFWRGSVVGSKPSVQAMCQALGLLALALTFGLLMNLVGLSPLSGILQAVQNAVTLVSAYSLMVFCLLTGNPGSDVSRRIRRRRIGLQVALIILVVCFVLGPLQDGVPIISGSYASSSFLLAYQFTFASYLGLAMVN